MRLLFILLTVFVLSLTYTSSAVAEEYDLSNHPIYNWEWNEDINFSNERYSNPKSSNDYTLAYSLSILKVDFDPTHIYYEKTVTTFDYCDLEQFSNYPKCK